MLGEIWLPALIISRLFVFDIYRAPNRSMSPTIKPGDIFITNKIYSGHYGIFGLDILTLSLGGNYKPGDIIAFQYPRHRNITYVKRIIAIGGDTVEHSNHTLIINGSPVISEAASDDQLNRKECLDSVCYQIEWRQPNEYKQRGHITVPADSYFVVGDNRDYSNDSRVWGTVPKSYVLGELLFNLGPGSRLNNP